MNDEEYLKCGCKECGNHIEFQPSSAGTVVECPHCGQWTELNAEKPGAEPPPKSKLPVLLAVIGCVVVAGAAAAFFLMRSHSGESATAPTVTSNQPLPKVAVTTSNFPTATAAPPKPAVVEKKEKSLDDLKPSDVRLEKAKVGSLVYAVGTVTNASEYQRFGVKVELDLFNKAGKKIGSTTDYKDIIEPNREWQFRAMVLDSKTTSAKVATLREE